MRTTPHGDAEHSFPQIARIDPSTDIGIAQFWGAPVARDIELDGEWMRWNGTETERISSPASVDEVGSIHCTTRDVQATDYTGALSARVVGGAE
jgi:hypothetical protein